MPHHVNADGTTHRPPASTAGLPPQTYAGRPATAGGLPVRAAAYPPPASGLPSNHATATAPSSAVGAVGTERLRAFTEAIVALHQVAPDVPGGIPLCICGMPARHCTVIKAEHDLLGMPMPFEFGPLAPHYFEV